ncbi:hypothetical protein ACQP2F_08650 [Actinoplanes sp. CA-030573]|uniref:hypothetical protein n=1 Tax=Actinoplanes sp. CA-030573 TaxID=3239898 RepID=UPI003D931FCE
MLRLETETLPWEFPPQTILDAVHETLYEMQWADPGPYVRSLDSKLTAANSVWRVATRSDGRRGLERRVGQTVAAVVEESIRTAPQQAAEHLRSAWDAAYGRHPDADKAFNEAIRAVEEVACPMVENRKANAGSATLGTVIGELRHNSSHKWELALPDATGHPREVGNLVGMMEILWQAQVSRHGGAPKSRRQDDDEARAIVPLASLLVHWMTSGVLRRRA